jgi:hypothetical protein
VELGGGNVGKYLGNLKVSRQGDRFYVVIPPLPVVRNLAGTRKLDFTAIPVVPEPCSDNMLPEPVEISFRAKITWVKRWDGAAWYKLNLPSRFNDVWDLVHKCGGSVKLVLNV